MKVVIFAGDLGTGISEEPDTRPNPIVEIGGNPLHGIIRNYPIITGSMNSLLALGIKVM